ncbi:insulinase family protein [Rickettsiales bacterium]|nr:insulinase family protein [Rickettsiales bacterium]
MKVKSLILFLVIFLNTKVVVSKIFDSKEFFLDNGLRVVLVENNRAPIVTHMIWYNVGSVDENYGKSGIAHFLEHLMFKGTTKFPGNYFSKFISSNGGSENAFTSYDYTAYYQTIPSEKIEQIIEMEADRMQNLTLTEKQVSTERKVILEERYQRIDSKPSSILDESLRKSLFPNHTYGTPIIGWEHEIKSLKFNDIFNFYRKYYVPQNATVVLSGDIDLQTAKKLTKKYYGKISSDNKTIQRLLLADPKLLTDSRVTYNNSDIKQKIWKRIYKAPSYKDSIKDGIALDIGLKIIAGGSTSILYDEFVKKKKMVSAIGGYYQGMSRDMGTIYFYAIPNAGIKILELEELIDKSMYEALDNKITEEKFKFQKKNYEHEATYLRDSIFQPAQIIGEALTIGLKLKEIENWNENLNSITIDDVKSAIKRFLENKNYVTGILG